MKGRKLIHKSADNRRGISDVQKSIYSEQRFLNPDEYQIVERVFYHGLVNEERFHSKNRCPRWFLMDFAQKLIDETTEAT